jgi:pyroglutamyl-peptidase
VERLAFDGEQTHTLPVPTVLLTAFEPFDGQALNASQRAMRAIDAEQLPGVHLVREELPTVFGESLQVLQDLIELHTPDLVVCLGQAGGRDGLSLERVAINVDDARIPDNAGAQPVDAAIADGGPVGYWSTLPIKAICQALHEAGFSVSVSQTAGTYVCNHVFYGLMHSLRQRDHVRGGFVHVPFCPDQVAELKSPPPSLASTTVARALELLLRITLSTSKDLVLPGGSEH